MAFVNYDRGTWAANIAAGTDPDSFGVTATYRRRNIVQHSGINYIYLPETAGNAATPGTDATVWRALSPVSDTTGLNIVALSSGVDNTVEQYGLARIGSELYWRTGARGTNFRPDSVVDAQGNLQSGWSHLSDEPTIPDSPFDNYTINGTPSITNSVPKWTSPNTLAWSTDTTGGGSGDGTVIEQFTGTWMYENVASTPDRSFSAVTLGNDRVFQITYNDTSSDRDDDLATITAGQTISFTATDGTTISATVSSVTNDETQTPFVYLVTTGTVDITGLTNTDNYTITFGANPVARASKPRFSIEYTIASGSTPAAGEIRANSFSDHIVVNDNDGTRDRMPDYRTIIANQEVILRLPDSAGGLVLERFRATGPSADTHSGSFGNVVESIPIGRAFNLTGSTHGLSTGDTVVIEFGEAVSDNADQVAVRRNSNNQVTDIQINDTNFDLGIEDWARESDRGLIPESKLPSPDIPSIEDELDTLALEQAFIYTRLGNGTTSLVRRTSDENFVNSLGLSLAFPSGLTAPANGTLIYGWETNRPSNADVTRAMGTDETPQFALRVESSRTEGQETLITFDIVRGREHIPTPNDPPFPDIPITDDRFDFLYTRVNAATQDEEVLTREPGAENSYVFRRARNTLGSLDGVDLTTDPNSGQVLGYNGTDWTAVNQTGGGSGTSVIYSPDGTTTGNLTRVEKIENANNARDLEFIYGNGLVDTLFSDSAGGVTYTSNAVVGANQARYNGSSRILTVMGVTIGREGDTLDLQRTPPANFGMEPYNYEMTTDTPATGEVAAFGSTFLRVNHTDSDGNDNSPELRGITGGTVQVTGPGGYDQTYTIIGNTDETGRQRFEFAQLFVTTGLTDGAALVLTFSQLVGTITNHIASIATAAPIVDPNDADNQIGTNYTLTEFDVDPTFIVGDTLDFTFIRPGTHRFLDGDGVLAPEQPNTQLLNFDIRNDNVNNRIIASDPSGRNALALAESNPLHGYHADNTAITGDIADSTLVVTAPTGDLTTLSTTSNSGIDAFDGTIYPSWIDTPVSDRPYLEGNFFVANTDALDDGDITVGTVFNLGTFAESQSSNSNAATRNRARAEVEVTHIGANLTGNGNVRNIRVRPHNSQGDVALRADAEQTAGAYDSTINRVYFSGANIGDVLNANSNTISVRAHPVAGIVTTQVRSDGNPQVHIEDPNTYIEPIVRRVNTNDDVAHITVTTDTRVMSFDVQTNTITRPNQQSADRTMRWDSRTNQLYLELTVTATNQLAAISDGRPINFSLTISPNDDVNFLVDREGLVGSGTRTSFTASANAAARDWLMDADNYSEIVDNVYYYTATPLAVGASPPSDYQDYNWAFSIPSGNANDIAPQGSFVFETPTSLVIDRFASSGPNNNNQVTPLITNSATVGDDISFHIPGETTPTAVAEIAVAGAIISNSTEVRIGIVSEVSSQLTPGTTYEIRMGTNDPGTPQVHSITHTDNTGVRYNPTLSSSLGFPALSTFRERTFDILATNNPTNFPVNPALGSRIFINSATDITRTITGTITNEYHALMFGGNPIRARRDAASLDRMLWFTGTNTNPGSGDRVRADQFITTLNAIAGQTVTNQAEVEALVNGANIRLDGTIVVPLADPFYNNPGGNTQGDGYGTVFTGNAEGSHRFYAATNGGLNALTQSTDYTVELEVSMMAGQQTQTLLSGRFYTFVGIGGLNADAWGWLVEAPHNAEMNP